MIRVIESKPKYLLFALITVLVSMVYKKSALYGIIIRSANEPRIRVICVGNILCTKRSLMRV